MTTRAEIIAEAREWIKTPYRHQGRLKGVAIDCAGLVGKVGEKFGLISAEDAKFTGYGRQPDPKKMRLALDRVLVRIPRADIKPADIPWLRDGDNARHIGIYSERHTLIHAIVDRDVEELPIESVGALVAVYRFKGIE